MRERIARLSEERKSVAEIVAILETEGRKVSHATVRKWIFRWQSNHGLKDQHRSGRPTKVTAEIAAFIESKLEEDDEITAVELQRLVGRFFSTEISAPTIRRYIRMTLEWEVVRTRFGPMISDRNKVKRHEFARMCIETKDTFDDVIWTDESSIQLTNHSRKMSVKIVKERVSKPVAMHTLKVHVWAEISKRGSYHICIFDQIMDSPLYVKILEDFLLPFIACKFQGYYIISVHARQRPQAYQSCYQEFLSGKEYQLVADTCQQRRLESNRTCMGRVKTLHFKAYKTSQ
jgi:transposase